MSKADKKTFFRIVGKKPHLISLMLLSAFAVMGAIVMTPALPTIGDFFGESISNTQLVITLFLLGYSLGQLLYGPLANRYGRKPALYIGIFIATLGSLFSIISSPMDSFNLLLLGRFLEAIGASAGLAVSFTIVNDYYYENDARRITSALMIAFAVVPGIAVTVGGFLVQYLRWQSCFYFLLLYGMVLLIAACRLPETLLEKDTNAMKFRKIVDKYIEKFSIKKLVGFAAVSGLSSACVYVFGAEGPFIGIHLLNTPPALYGSLALLPYVGTLIGSLLLIKFSHVNPHKILKIAFSLEVVGVFSMLFLFLFKAVSLYTMLIPMGIFCLGHPMIAASSISLAMQQHGDKANTSAVLNFIGMGMPVLLTLLLSASHVTAAWVMPSIFLVALLLMILIYCLMMRSTSSQS